VAEVPVDGMAPSGLFAARPALIRALNEQLLLDHIRSSGPYSRADLARLSGLSKPTVSLALANLERAGLIQLAGQRTGLPGRTALLYEVRPEAGFVLGLDIGLRYLRGAVADLAGEVRARRSVPVHAKTVADRVAELVALADELCAGAGITRAEIIQTVVGSPGVYDPQRNLMALTGGLPGWDRPEALAGLRTAFGPALAIENDVDAAALAERALGVGQEADNFAFVHVGSGVGMGLVLGGRLHRGVHGVAGEIAFMPLGRDPRAWGDTEAGAGSLAGSMAGSDAGSLAGSSAGSLVGPLAGSSAGPLAGSSAGPLAGPFAASRDGSGADDESVAARPEGVIIDPAEARRRGTLEIAAGADGIVRAARRAGLTGLATPQAVFEAAAAGDERAAAVMADEARLVAAAICCVIAVVDPSLIVLGGGIGQAPGFAEAVTRALEEIAPVLPDVKVSALGTDVVVDGCLAEATAMAWTQLIASLP
jgi:predicted NBD/HSP70 family sugar kinase